MSSQLPGSFATNQPIAHALPSWDMDGYGLDWLELPERYASLPCLRIPRHPATQSTNIRPPVPRSSGQAVGAQRRRFALLV